MDISARGLEERVHSHTPCVTHVTIANASHGSHMSHTSKIPHFGQIYPWDHTFCRIFCHSLDFFFIKQTAYFETRMFRNLVKVHQNIVNEKSPMTFKSSPCRKLHILGELVKDGTCNMSFFVVFCVFDFLSMFYPFFFPGAIFACVFILSCSLGF